MMPVTGRGWTAFFASNRPGTRCPDPEDFSHPLAEVRQEEHEDSLHHFHLVGRLHCGLTIPRR